jgi:hypothetical protein
VGPLQHCGPKGIAAVISPRPVDGLEKCGVARRWQRVRTTSRGGWNRYDRYKSLICYVAVQSDGERQFVEILPTSTLLSSLVQGCKFAPASWILIGLAKAGATCSHAQGMNLRTTGASFVKLWSLTMPTSAVSS